jgi:hypothetical protein
MVPFKNFSAVTEAYVELLLKTEGFHSALGPRTTVVVTEFVVPTIVKVSSMALLEFNPGPESIRRVAVPL